MRLTKAQAAALQKWVDYGNPAHQKLLGVNEGVFDRLWAKGFLKSHGFLVKYPSEKGLEALDAYNAAKVTREATGK